MAHCFTRPNECESSFVAQEFTANFSNEAFVMSDGCLSANHFEGGSGKLYQAASCKSITGW